MNMKALITTVFSFAALSTVSAKSLPVYFGTYTGGSNSSKGIYRSVLDLGTGKLSEPVLAAEAGNPSFLEIHPNGKFLYAVSESGRAGSVSAYAIDKHTGGLKLLNKQLSGGAGPCHVSIDHAGRNVLVANYGSGSASAIPIKSNGRLAEPAGFAQHTGSSVNLRRQKAPHAHSINVSPDNRFAFVADLGIDKIMIYRLDTEKGTIVKNSPPFARVKPGAGPRHFAFHPNGKYAYVINELDGTVTAFAYEPASGTLTEIQTITTLPDGFNGANSCAEVRVHPGGKFLYGSNRGHDSIVVYRVNSAKGTLNLVEHETADIKTPRNFNIDPTGRFCLVANQGKDSVIVFRINQKTGALKPTGHKISIAKPVCIRFLRPGRNAYNNELAVKMLNNTDLTLVLEKAKSILKKGLNAGSGYGEVWIRDLNTFIELALEVQDKAELRRSLLVFFHFQSKDGNIIDGYIPAEKANVSYKYIRSNTMPNLLGHKNTVETDQESSLVQAVHKYVRKTGDYSILSEKINGFSVRQRLSMALRYLLEHRYDSGYGLIWGATTSDWGDVQPEHSWGVELDSSSHRSIDIYDNAMFVIAIKNYISLITSETSDQRMWKSVTDKIKANTRKLLWDRELHKFRPHLYLEDSPFPEDFDEHRIYYHGGTAIAIEAGILSKEEVLQVFNDMVSNKMFAGAGSIGLTVYPPYPAGFFKNKSMRPFSYQNGGDWTWFGGRMIQQLIAYGYVEQAYQECLPMLERVRVNNGFFEWYTVDNKPSGSGTFRGSAGVLGKAVQMFLNWAKQQ